MITTRANYPDDATAQAVATYRTDHPSGEYITVFAKREEIRRLAILLDLGGYDTHVTPDPMRDTMAALVAYPRTPEAQTARVAELRQSVQELFASLKA